MKKRIALLIPTHQRNPSLLRLLAQIADFLSTYQGHNFYEICVADSDPNNPLAEGLSTAGLRYSLNEGEGFDDNLLTFWRNHAASYDYIFSISDDDLFKPGANPLYVLDAAVDRNLEAILFNHRDYSLTPAGLTEIKALFYPDFALEFNRARLLRNILTLLPRHVGLLYSTPLLRDNLATLATFRNTLHVYAAPLILACLHDSSAFFDYALCLFHTAEKTDGAWHRGEAVLTGLATFLESLKRILPPDLYHVAETGFFHNYLGTNSWLRAMLPANAAIPSETELRHRLNEITT